MAHFVVVPQWQGSSSSRAMQLVDGALAIADDLPRSARTLIEVPSEAGEQQGTGVRRFTTLQRLQRAVHDEAADHAHVVVVGGDNSVALGAMAARLTTDTALVWFGAHSALHTPESAPHQALHEMTVRAALAEAAPGLDLATGLLAPNRVVVAGVRAWDAEERVRAERSDLHRADVQPDEILTAVKATGATRAYVHVDLDVLDPAEIDGVSRPVPFGARTSDLVATIRALRSAYPLVGASLAEYAPAQPEAAASDLGTILRIIGALA